MNLFNNSNNGNSQNNQMKQNNNKLGNIFNNNNNDKQNDNKGGLFSNNKKKNSSKGFFSGNNNKPKKRNNGGFFSGNNKGNKQSSNNGKKKSGISFSNIFKSNNKGSHHSSRHKGSNKIMGIDLGTTNSAVAIIEGGRPKIIVNPDGGRTTPSIVSFKNGTHIVGIKAKREQLLNPHTVASIKRHMGDKHFQVKIGKQSFNPQQISAMILSYIKNFVSQYVGFPINKAVITVPAYFDDAQRQATKDAGQIAGLDVKRILNEPTAASLAYGADKQDKQKILVYDLGGGTFDVSILQLGNNVFQVLATNGNTHLGGDDFDYRIMTWLIADFQKKHHIDLTKNKMAMQRIKDASEEAKIELSSNTQTTIYLPFITSTKQGPLNIEKVLTRAQFNKLTGDLVDKTLRPILKALSDAHLSFKDINTVILNGGSTRIPLVRQKIKGWTQQEPNHSVNPDEAVALGAALQGGILSGEVKNIVLLDVTPLSLGIRTKGGTFTPLIKRNTTIPTEHTQAFSTTTDNQRFVRIQVLQGDRPIASQDETLGSFELDNIPKAPRGVPQIVVTFSIDKNGIVSVNAKDRDTGKDQKIIIKSANGLSQQKIKDMQRLADENKDADLATENNIKKSDTAHQLILDANKAESEHAQELPTNIINQIDQNENILEQAVKNNQLNNVDQSEKILKKQLADVSLIVSKNRRDAEDKKELQQETNINTNDNMPSADNINNNAPQQRQNRATNLNNQQQVPINNNQNQQTNKLGNIFNNSNNPQPNTQGGLFNKNNNGNNGNKLGNIFNQGNNQQQPNNNNGGLLHRNNNGNNNSKLGNIFSKNNNNNQQNNNGNKGLLHNVFNKKNK